MTDIGPFKRLSLLGPMTSYEPRNEIRRLRVLKVTETFARWCVTCSMFSSKQTNGLRLSKSGNKKAEAAAEDPTSHISDV